MNIRPLIEIDYQIIASIYKKGIDTGIATFETEVPNWNDWNKKFILNCRFVVEIDSIVVGWSALSLVSDRKVYSGVVENTIYIDPNYQGRNIGKLLLKHHITESEKLGFWTLQAAIFPQNKASITLHKSCRFRIIGFREKIAKRNGIWHDNILMERRSNLF